MDKDNIKKSLIKNSTIQSQTIELHSSKYENSENIKIYLEQNGYDKSLINYLFFFFEISSVEQALNLLSKDKNGIWQHPRINTTSMTCLICKEKDSPHISDFNITISTFNDKKDSSLLVMEHTSAYYYKEKIAEDFLCSICLNGVISNLNLSNICEHKYCINCYQTYILGKLTVQDVLGIKCLEYSCKYVYTDNDIKKIFYNDEESYKKYLLIKEKKLKEKENLTKKSKHCPEINCEGWLKYEKKNKFVTCEFGHKYCYNCLQKWHSRNKYCTSSNVSNVDKDFQRWKKGKLIKRCPKCNYFTEKSYGCNHIICANCKYHWCWLCLKEYSDEHFNSGKCQGLQFSESKYIQNQCCFECFSIFCYMRYFYLFVLLVLAFSAFGGPIAMVSIYIFIFEKNSTFEDMNISAWLMVGTYALTGLFLQPLCFLTGALTLLVTLSFSVLYPPFTKKFNKLFDIF